jgi:hypothetical protein
MRGEASKFLPKMIKEEGKNGKRERMVHFFFEPPPIIG